MRLMAPGVRNGFPFVIPKADQWDGAHWFTEEDIGASIPHNSDVSVNEYLDLFATYVPVCGPGTFYPIGMTRAQFSKYYWRVKTWELDVTSFPPTPDPSDDDYDSELGNFNNARTDGSNPVYCDIGSNYGALGWEPVSAADHLLGGTPPATWNENQLAVPRQIAVAAVPPSGFFAGGNALTGAFIGPGFDNSNGHLFATLGGPDTPLISFVVGAGVETGILLPPFSSYAFPPAVLCNQDGLYYPFFLYGLSSAMARLGGYLYLVGSLAAKVSDGDNPPTYQSAITPGTLTFDPSAFAWSFSGGGAEVEIMATEFWEYADAGGTALYDADSGDYTG